MVDGCKNGDQAGVEMLNGCLNDSHRGFDHGY